MPGSSSSSAATTSDPLFLQSKEAQPSVLERFLGESAYSNYGQRVVVGQHLMQAATDIFLGWWRVTGLDGRRRDYYIRQLHDWKGSVDAGDVARAGRDGLRRAVRRDARPCPRALGRPDRDRLLPGQRRRIRPGDRRFAAAYADQNERDFEAFADAVKTGRIHAETSL